MRTQSRGRRRSAAPGRLELRVAACGPGLRAALCGVRLRAALRAERIRATVCGLRLRAAGCGRRLRPAVRGVRPSAVVRGVGLRAPVYGVGYRAVVCARRFRAALCGLGVRAALCGVVLVAAGLAAAGEGAGPARAAGPEAWKAEGGRLDSEYAHLLFPLAWLVRVDDCERHRRWLDQVVQFLVDHQDPCGAIFQVVTNQESTEIRPEDRRIIVHPLRTNEEYGQEEVPIVYQTGDPGTDLLYTMNFAFLGLHEAARATGWDDYAQAADRMADFLVRVQTLSEARPELSGTWYRGFDFKRWDYWGSDGDWGYGVLTTQTGWTHSLIAATFALRRMNISFWDLTKTSTIARDFDVYRARMIPDDVI